MRIKDIALKVIEKQISDILAQKERETDGYGFISINQLSKKTGLNYPTLLNLIKSMEQFRLVHIEKHRYIIKAEDLSKFKFLDENSARKGEVNGMERGEIKSE